jgi:hypothetical protein
MSRPRNAESFRRREMRASAFRCAPAESSGATRRKKRCVGFPSSDWKSTPPRLRPKAATTRFRPGSFPCGMATPSPSAVLFSRSRVEVDLGMVVRHHPGQLLDDLALAPTRERGNDERRGEHVGDLHARYRLPGSIRP